MEALATTDDLVELIQCPTKNIPRGVPHLRCARHIVLDDLRLLSFYVD